MPLTPVPVTPRRWPCSGTTARRTPARRRSRCSRPPPGTASAGCPTLEHHLTAGGEDETTPFTPADEAALSGPWSWLAGVAEEAFKAGLDGMVDDDLALVAPWGFDPGRITVPVLLIHGDEDRMVPCAHGQWLARRCPSAELRLYPGEGHVSVLNFAEAAVG